MKPVTTILSMLHEPPEGSATRLFRREPVLAWTLRRLRLAAGLDHVTVVCWDDQSEAASKCGAEISNHGPRRAISTIETVAAARRWSDGWRGGLLGTCEFDRGFDAPWIAEIARRQNTDSILLVDPAAALVDPKLIEALLARRQERPDLDTCFSQVAPGLSGVLLSADFLKRLATTQKHPGLLLCYLPDSPRHDPIGDPASVVVPTPLARTTRRFTLDSNRQTQMLENATAHLNGELISTDAMGLLSVLEASNHIDDVPREIVLELNTDRATDAIFRPGKQLSIHRPPLELSRAKELFNQLNDVDDLRLVFAGVGDPLLHDQCLQIINAARSAGIRAVSLESDFVGVSADRITALAESAVDVVSLHLPAVTAATYKLVMGSDQFEQAVSNLKTFISRRAIHGRGVPLLVPTFVKCRQNLAEMEIWYDHWLRALGCAVITGPSDYGREIPDVSVADMSGPNRKPCLSLSRRLMILSTGQIVSCEQDVLARQPLGNEIKPAFRRAQEMRAESWTKHPVCAACNQWNRL